MQSQSVYLTSSTEFRTHGNFPIIDRNFDGLQMPSKNVKIPPFAIIEQLLNKKKLHFSCI